MISRSYKNDKYLQFCTSSNVEIWDPMLTIKVSRLSNDASVEEVKGNIIGLSNRTFERNHDEPVGNFELIYCTESKSSLSRGSAK